MCYGGNPEERDVYIFIRLSFSHLWLTKPFENVAMLSILGYTILHGWKPTCFIQFSNHSPIAAGYLQCRPWILSQTYTLEGPRSGLIWRWDFPQFHSFEGPGVRHSNQVGTIKGQNWGTECMLRDVSGWIVWGMKNLEKPWKTHDQETPGT